MPKTKKYLAASVGILLLAAVVTATVPVGVTVSRWAGVIEAGHFKHHEEHTTGLKFELKTNMDTDFTMSSVIVNAGGNVGWHTHTGPVFINVRKGTLTLLEYRDGACERRDVVSGLTILEQGTALHNAYNLTGATVEYATAAWAPRGVPQRIDMPDPGCVW
jgi:hypothetical protein